MRDTHFRSRGLTTGQPIIPPRVPIADSMSSSQHPRSFNHVNKTRDRSIRYTESPATTILRTAMRVIGDPSTRKWMPVAGNRARFRGNERNPIRLIVKNTLGIWTIGSRHLIEFDAIWVMWKETWYYCNLSETNLCFIRLIFSNHDAQYSGNIIVEDIAIRIQFH